MDLPSAAGPSASGGASGTTPADGGAAGTYSPAPRRSRRGVVGWIAGALLVLLLVLGGAVIHVSANRSFDQAAAELSSATRDARDAADELDVVADDAGDAVAASEAIVGSAADDLIDVAARTALADQAAAMRESVDAAQARLSAGPSSELPEKPLWTWELLEATPTLEATAAELTEFAEELDADETAIQDAEAALVGSAVALYASAPAAAAALEAANVSAVNDVVLDFRDARDAVAGQTAVGSGAVDAFRTYAEKASTLKASAQTELAEKAGPLLGTRLEIEAFARSIAGGVVLDFDWAPIVNNIGGSAGMGGTATLVAMRGGFSTITLSDSVAENWPSADAQALVAHEVGHAITAKCSDMFDSTSGPANEQWATAWAGCSSFQRYSLRPATVAEGLKTISAPPRPSARAPSGKWRS